MMLLQMIVVERHRNVKIGGWGNVVKSRFSRYLSNENEEFAIISYESIELRYNC